MEIFSEEERRRFRELRHDELNGCLEPDKQAELATLKQKIYHAEADYLRPAAERQEARLRLIEAQNVELEALAKRKEALVQHLEQTLAEAQRERAAIAAEQKRILHTPEAETELSGAGAVR